MGSTMEGTTKSTDVILTIHWSPETGQFDIRPNGANHMEVIGLLKFALSVVDQPRQTSHKAPHLLVPDRTIVS